jgi:flagella basal body P-ring formation protein FlgA
MKLLFILITCVALSPGECIRVNGAKITVSELAPAVPALSALDPEAVVGYTPLPGVQRTLSSRELLVFLRQHGSEPQAAIPSLCVERAVQPIERADVTVALTGALNIPDARLELLDFSNQPVPPGHLEFSRGGLNRPPPDAPDTPVVWRGRWVYDGDRTLAVWAKVKITVQRTAVVAAERIPAGSTIRLEQLKVSQTVQFPFSDSPLDSPMQVTDRTARQSIPEGQRIVRAFLAEPKLVLQGERVHVRVVDGLATLSLDAIAQSTGSKGDTVLMRNPESGKSFRGVVEDKGTVIVRSSEGVE